MIALRALTPNEPFLIFQEIEEELAQMHNWTPMEREHVFYMNEWWQILIRSLKRQQLVARS